MINDSNLVKMRVIPDTRNALISTHSNQFIYTDQDDEWIIEWKVMLRIPNQQQIVITVIDDSNQEHYMGYNWLH